jgi:hypothetical protein
MNKDKLTTTQLSRRKRNNNAWISHEFPDDEITVLLRLESPDWPIMLGWKDGDVWRDLSGDKVDCTVLGWMHMEAARDVLDYTVSKRCATCRNIDFIEPVTGLQGIGARKQKKGGAS